MESDMTSMSSEAPWKRLHPSSLWVNIVPQIWRSIRVLWPLLLAILFTDRPGGTSWIDLVYSVCSCSLESFAALCIGPHSDTGWIKDVWPLKADSSIALPHYRPAANSKY